LRFSYCHTAIDESGGNMKSSLEEAIQRTALSHSNQMEMLTFRLTDHQLYGINVFKIIEILECPRIIDRMPRSHPVVKGALNFRGSPIAAIDLSQAVGLDPKDFRNELAYVIICEYNQLLTAFIIHAPESLLTRSWQDIQKPNGINSESLVAIAYADDNEAIMLLDIETILATVVGIDSNLSSDIIESDAGKGHGYHVLVVDDSRTALAMMQSVLDRLGFASTAFSSAATAFEYLARPDKAIDLIISDIEMPGMDGFTFTRNIKDNPEYKHFRILLHSSMSNPSNRLKAEQAGADDFVAKFDPDVLAKKVFQLTGRGEA
jgi:two-component system chemotaxis response regulator CheV